MRPVAPGGVVGDHVDDERPDLGGGGWPPWWSLGLGPVAGDSSTVPAQEGVRGDEPAGASWPGERGCHRGEQAPIVIGQLRSAGLSAQHGHLGVGR